MQMLFAIMQKHFVVKAPTLAKVNMIMFNLCRETSMQK